MLLLNQLYSVINSSLPQQLEHVYEGNRGALPLAYFAFDATWTLAHGLNGTLEDGHGSWDSVSITETLINDNNGARSCLFHQSLQDATIEGLTVSHYIHVMHVNVSHIIFLVAGNHIIRYQREQIAEYHRHHSV